MRYRRVVQLESKYGQGFGSSTQELFGCQWKLRDDFFFKISKFGFQNFPSPQGGLRQTRSPKPWQIQTAWYSMFLPCSNFQNQQQGFDRGSAYSKMTRFHRETRGICRSAMASTLSVSMDVWSYHSSNPHSVGIYFPKPSMLTRYTMTPQENGTSWPSWYVCIWRQCIWLQWNKSEIFQRTKFEVPGISVDAHLTDGPRGTSGLG